MQKVAVPWMFFVLSFASFISPMLCRNAFASDIYVGIGERYTTIQAGANAATTGDVVIVRDGTYTGVGNKAIDFKGKAITVRSENGSDSCIIDMEGLGTGFIFKTGEGSSSIVSGFTIRRGNASIAGGVYCGDGTSPTIADCLITANSSTVEGGGLYCDSGSSPVITNCTISGNSATYGGGGVYCNDSTAVITGCTISNNSAGNYSGGGGGVSCGDSSITIINCTISGNSAGDYSDGGGGIHCDNSSVTITGCTISGNSAGNHYCGGGGILYRSSSASIISCSITGNSASSGGGGIYTHSSSLTVDNCIINSNSSNYSGAGLCNYESLLTVINCNIYDNSAIPYGSGGGIYCGYNSSMKIMDCCIRSNLSGQYGQGGGICCYSGLSGEITNCTIIGNSSSSSGGGIWCYFFNVSIMNCTIAGNMSVSGGGVFASYCKPSITNSIVWGNSAGVAFTEYSPEVSYSDVQEGYSGAGNINVNPLFVDALNGDYHLQETSPCIDVGTVTGAPSEDMDGDGRPYGAGVDMGADEYAPDFTPPTVSSISRSVPSGEFTNAAQVSYTVAFSEKVTGLSASNFSLTTSGLTGAAVGSVSGSGKTWTVAVITGSGDGSLELNMTSGTGVTDASGNALSGAPVAGESYTIDKTAPIVSAGADVGANAQSTQTATASDSHAMTYAWTMVSGPGAISFGSSDALSTTMEADAEGTYLIQFTATDAAGNSASDSMTLTWDQTAPMVSITSTASDPTSVNPIPLTITFSEAVTGFTVSDITVTNGTAFSFSGSGASYTVNITSSSDGGVVVGVAAGVAQDACGNANLAANKLEIEYDSAAPTVSISTTSSETFQTSTMLVTITFSKAVTGFTISDITVTNGTLSSFTAASSAVYTVVVTPAAEGAVTVKVALGVAVDSAGNGNTVSATLTRTYAKPAFSWLPLLLE
jgi:hypothetical protein